MNELRDVVDQYLLERVERAEAQLRRAEAVVAVQRDTLEGLVWVATRNGLENDPYVYRAQGLLLDAEGVSESEPRAVRQKADGPESSPDSLTSPVDGGKP